MGFNIGSFLGSVAPFLGGAIAGPIGAVIGGGISAALRPDQVNAATVGRQTQPGPVSSTGSQGFSPNFFISSSTGPAPQAASLTRIPNVIRDIGIGLGLGELPRFLGGPNGNGNPISRILAKARAATGGAVTRNKIIDAAKTCSLEVAAQTFGLDVREVCLVVVKGRSRRRRGVSAADIRRTKRTIHFASKIRKDLKVLAK